MLIFCLALSLHLNRVKKVFSIRNGDHSNAGGTCGRHTSLSSSQWGRESPLLFLAVHRWGGNSHIICQSSNKHDCSRRIKNAIPGSWCCRNGDVSVCCIANSDDMPYIWNAQSYAAPFVRPTHLPHSHPHHTSFPPAPDPADKPRLLELSQSFGRNKLIKRIIKSLPWRIRQLEIVSYMSEFDWI